MIVVPSGSWFAAELSNSTTLDKVEAYSLFGLCVAPGFTFDRFELALREHLSKLFPEHADLISRLTR